MLIQILYPYLRFSLGTLFPAYKTWKALKRKDETSRRRWMKYWVSFAAFQSFETVSDFTLVYILPFYIELKTLFLVWTVLGTRVVFDSIVNRELLKREKTIDKLLKRISKVRDELIALLWFEISRCSVKLVATIMSGGLAVLANPIQEQVQPCQQTSPNVSDDEDDDEDRCQIEEISIDQPMDQDLNVPLHGYVLRNKV